jgi:hypothetical protein
MDAIESRETAPDSASASASASGEERPDAAAGRIQLLRRTWVKSADASGRGPDGGPRQFAIALAICLLLVGASVSWRQKVYFDGDLDPVVIAKGLLTVIALMMCLWVRLNCARPNPVGRRTVTLVAALVAVATLGGVFSGDGMSSAIVAVRVAMVGIAAYLLVRSFQVDVLLRALFTSMAAVGMLAVLTGAVKVAAGGGRLEGGIPPLAANEIALLCGVPALALAWRYLSHRGRSRDLVVVLVLLGAVVASESRTGLAALVVAGVVMLAQARRIPPLAIGLLAAAVVGALYVAIATNVVAGYFGRSDEGSVGTLNSRTIAWSAAMDLHQGPAAWLLGGGLAMKKIPVSGQYWKTQGLDSSWVSAWVQGGAIALGLFAVIVVGALVSSWRTPKPYRMLITGVLVFQFLRSFLESGLMDATPSFLLFMTMAMLAEAGSRPILQTAAQDWPAVEAVPATNRNRLGLPDVRQLLRR